MKYANKPEDEKVGINEIKNVLQKDERVPTNFVHRGHSYHVKKSLEHLPFQSRFVYLGSCGGFNNINKVLAQAERASVLATKGTGTMWVNDPLLKMIDEWMLKGEGIEWDKLWAKAEKRFLQNKKFKDYVNPANNISVMFINTYKKLRVKSEK